MSTSIQSFLANIGAVGIIAAALAVLVHPQWVGLEHLVNNVDETATTTSGVAESTDTVQSVTVSPAVPASDKNYGATKPAPAPRKETASSSPKSVPLKTIQPVPPAPASASASASATTTDTFQAARISNPYPFPPQSFIVINESTRAALVNILCGARNGTFSPISASGVIIDPRGIILTNAHVAQYLLLAGDPTVDLSCVIRAGSPAYPQWNAEVLYIPPSWVKEHASDIKKSRPLGTGEYDYALLRITQGLNGQPPPAPSIGGVPFVPIDAREAIAFTDDHVLAASYPAEFAGGIVTQLNLYPASSVTSIKKMMTLGGDAVDVVSLGGIIGAQSGSSGGAVVNAWGRLVGIISTTSEGATTAERDLHAITLSYINRSISSESGLDLAAILGGDVARYARLFNSNTAPALRRLLIDQIKGH